MAGLINFDQRERQEDKKGGIFTCKQVVWQTSGIQTSGMTNTTFDQIFTDRTIEQI